jgi:hypothetical protein
MVKIHINKECNDKNELSVLLRHIADLIDKGGSYGNTWNVIDMSEREEKIEFIKKVLNTWGTTSTSELELESSPIYNNLTGKICTLVEEFTEDYVRVVTYDDDIDIDEEDVPYEKLSDDLIDEIYSLIEQYNIVQEKLYDSIRDENF